ncbi:beta-ketoacyl-ACP synthase III [Polluticoccus soli]|uniref:beta-ketoacyl-ACP synthase III n=1 Tax=Polluticoccus soli TaxID=3034150 RepID=UPI0023E1773F|nr:beta-ketoacyl-ACP synthase III [Flavipsychrobacter sp. JY13-12]
MRPVYITRLSKFFPNDPVANDEMESVLGMVNDKPSKARAIVLRNNGIKTRYYAYKDGVRTHTNAQIATNAIKGLFDEKLPASKLQVLAVGTTSPEQILPSQAAMIHGELRLPRLELISAQGACCSSMQALKYAYMSVASGLNDTAAACGTERFSAYLQASRFQPEADNMSKLTDNPILAFEKDFLRWMLSDGAGAALLQPEPNKNELSLKIEWLEITSFADELETCMYAGGVKAEDKSLTGWNDMEINNWTNDSVFSLKQDTRLLGENIVPKGGVYLAELMQKHNLTVDDVDHYLPHMSSEYFKNQIIEHHKRIGMDIPMEKWFYNLTKVGNVGSASPYLMLEELYHSGKLKKGERILVMVPESARFTYAYLYLTVV